MLKMFQYPQAKICPSGQNASVPPFCILLAGPAGHQPSILMSQ